MGRGGGGDFRSQVDRSFMIQESRRTRGHRKIWQKIKRRRRGAGAKIRNCPRGRKEDYLVWRDSVSLWNHDQSQKANRYVRPWEGEKTRSSRGSRGQQLSRCRGGKREKRMLQGPEIRANVPRECGTSSTQAKKKKKLKDPSRKVEIEKKRKHSPLGKCERHSSGEGKAFARVKAGGQFAKPDTGRTCSQTCCRGYKT